jgi:hypothetical protein
MGDKMTIFTGSGLGVGKGRIVGGKIAPVVGRWPIWVGIGSDVTAIDVGAESVANNVRVGSTVPVGTSVKSSSCCGALVKLQAASKADTSISVRSRSTCLPESKRLITFTFLLQV